MTAKVRLRGEIELEPEFVSNILITAFDANYGGCWSWAAPAGDDWLLTEKTDADETRWTEVMITDKEEQEYPPVVHVVTDEQIALGLTKMIELGGEWARDAFGWISDQEDADIDAEDANNIVQLGLFNELVYG
jgi:hypothetical protein